MSRFTGLGPVFRREFKSYFSSPLGYVFIVIFLLASGYLTVSRDFGRFLEIRQANLDAFYAVIDHKASCPDCGGIGGYVELHDGMQPFERECPEAKRLTIASFTTK